MINLLLTTTAAQGCGCAERPLVEANGDLCPCKVSFHSCAKIKTCQYKTAGMMHLKPSTLFRPIVDLTPAPFADGIIIVDVTDKKSNPFCLQMDAPIFAMACAKYPTLTCLSTQGCTSGGCTRP